MNALASPAEVLEKLMVDRHSCRGFLPRPVAEETIDRILAIAQRTASWCNAQPWHVHVVSGAPLERLRERFERMAAEDAPAQPELDWPREYSGVYRQRRRECGMALYEAAGIAMGDRVASARQARENFRFFGAPHLAIVTTPEALGTHGAIDCGAWISSFMLAAAAMGVASIAQAALASWPQVLRKELSLPPDRKVVCGVSFGYEDASHPANSFRTSRAATQENVTRVS